MPRVLSVFVFALALVLAPRAAADELAACFRAHEDAQQLRRDGALSATRAALDVCTREVCPAPVREDCGRWLDEVNAAQPTVVVVARDQKTGAMLRNVRVRVDGRLVEERLTGRAFPVDPGERRLRVEAADGRVIDRKLLIAEGDKARRFVVVFAAPPDRAPPPSKETGPHPAVYVLGGLGAAGVVLFAVLAGVGFSKEKGLADSCEPNCTEDEIDEVQRLYIAGDVAGAVGIACGIAALVVGLTDAYAEADARLLLVPGGARLEARW